MVGLSIGMSKIQIRRGGCKLDPIKKNSVKAYFFLGLIIATVVSLGVLIIGALGIHDVWPAFFIMISFFITGADIKNLPNIFIGCITLARKAGLIPPADAAGH